MDRVVGTIGYVPIEEYLFFVLQCILTGLWLYWLLAHKTESTQQESPREFRIVMLILGILLSVVGFYMLLGFSLGIPSAVSAMGDWICNTVDDEADLALGNCYTNTVPMDCGSNCHW